MMIVVASVVFHISLAASYFKDSSLREIDAWSCSQVIMAFFAVDFLRFVGRLFHSYSDLISLKGLASGVWRYVSHWIR